MLKLCCLFDCLVLSFSYSLLHNIKWQLLISITSCGYHYTTQVINLITFINLTTNFKLAQVSFWWISSSESGNSERKRQNVNWFINKVVICIIRCKCCFIVTVIVEIIHLFIFIKIIFQSLNTFYNNFLYFSDISTTT